MTSHPASSPSSAPVSIKQEDLIQSVADALQYISYYHPVDYIRHLARAYEAEQSPAAKDAIAQILTNSRMCAEGRRPLCQDTGSAVVHVEVGQDVHINGGYLIDAINEGIRKGYGEGYLRKSIAARPFSARTNRVSSAAAASRRRSDSSRRSAWLRRALICVNVVTMLRILESCWTTNK